MVQPSSPRVPASRPLPRRPRARVARSRPGPPLPVPASPLRSPAAPAPVPLGIRRGYAEDDLHALAEIAYHYLGSGGLRLAVTIFEGLVALAPSEPYFALALGLANDRLERDEDAAACYRRAALLDEADGRPEINLAELAIARGARAEALPHLRRGLEKARARDDAPLVRKAEALIAVLAAWAAAPKREPR